MDWLVNSWYQSSPIRWLLAPLSGLYRIIIGLRRYLYRYGLLQSTSLSVPVIIVGNISVGGTGKTPVVIWLAKQLQQAGYHPGIISRGYGGKSPQTTKLVTKDSIASDVGDEPIIIFRQTACPMVVGANRVAAGQKLLDNYDCDVIISDDGLQHYALKRDVELVVIDGKREFGNQYCLPAGPLREPLSRLKSVNALIHNGSNGDVVHNMQLIQTIAVNLLDSSITRPIDNFKATEVHAIAGIGNPTRFFDQLSAKGLNLTTHSFADHHPFKLSDIDFGDQKTILMTEKDAVKCQHFAHKNMWYIPIEATISGKLNHYLLDTLAGLSSHG
ncbi:tetraacyldisaccharide 4'-kinase [Pseudomonadota bacterium]|nr:tetraacyldisaccharide 4'-kinase [Pseudomonadota bacterium]